MQKETTDSIAESRWIESLIHLLSNNWIKRCSEQIIDQKNEGEHFERHIISTSLLGHSVSSEQNERWGSLDKI